jgi:hypothetical protein
MRRPGFTGTRAAGRAASASLVLLAAVFLSVSVSQASVRVREVSIGGDVMKVHASATYGEWALSFGTRGGCDTIRLAGADLLRDPGMPELPVETVRIALPHGMTVTGVHVSAVESLELPGTYAIGPCGIPQPIAELSGAASDPGGDPRIYRSAQPFPSHRVVLLGQTDLAGQSVAVLRIHPVQYIPAEQRLDLVTSMEIVLEGSPGHVCGDYLPAAATARARAAYERVLEGMVANPGDVSLREGSGAPGPRLLDPGAYEYVIITGPEWVDDFQPLGDWRTRKGSPARIVTTTWIYNVAGYSGTDLEMIRAFVIDAHGTWGATHFLLGGDTNTIPDDVRQIEVPGYGVHDLANDTYFSDYDDDWVNEVHVGRVSVRTAGEIAVFIDKIFTYEKDPPPGYATTAAFFGFDIAEPGDGHGEISKENIRNLHLPLDWTLSTEYDSEPGTHRADVLAYLNAGHHLVNHHDHCNENAMGTGWISHGHTIIGSDVNALVNGDRQSIVFAIGCLSANVPYHTTIGETFVKNPNGGAIAYMGNSGWGWGGSLEDTDWYTVRQDRFFYRNLFDDGFEKLGENFSDLKNDEFSFDDPYNLHRYCFIQLHLLGDPEMPVWSAAPRVLTVAHDDTVYLGRGTFVVHVESEGSPADGALVCLWKGEEVYETAETVAGDASFALAPTSPGTLLVTASYRNHIPYEGKAIVTYDPTSVEAGEGAVPPRLALVSALPNPFGPTTEIAYSVPPGPARVRLDVYNCRGQHVRTLVRGEMAPGTHRVTWDGVDDLGQAVASGIYFCEIRAGTERDVRKVALVR